MRTTLVLDDALLRQAKQRAAERNLTLSRLVNEALRYSLAPPEPVALIRLEQLAGHPRCRLASPTIDRLEDVLRLCRAVGATGRMVADAQHAALATAEGCTWVTPDRDFARFEPHGLRWQHLALG